MIVESWNQQWNCADSMVYMFFLCQLLCWYFFTSRSEIESNSKTRYTFQQNEVSAIGTYCLDTKKLKVMTSKKSKLMWYLARNAEASGIQNHLGWETTNKGLPFYHSVHPKTTWTRLVAMPFHLLRSQIFRAAWSVGKSWSSKWAMKKRPLIVWGI